MGRSGLRLNIFLLFEIFLNEFNLIRIVKSSDESSMKREDVPLIHAGLASDFELQKEYFNEGKIFILQIESTLRCPQLCNYCYAGSRPDSPHGMSSE